MYKTIKAASYNVFRQDMKETLDNGLPNWAKTPPALENPESKEPVKTSNMIIPPKDTPSNGRDVSSSPPREAVNRRRDSQESVSSSPPREVLNKRRDSHESSSASPSKDILNKRRDSKESTNTPPLKEVMNKQKDSHESNSALPLKEVLNKRRDSHESTNSDTQSVLHPKEVPNKRRDSNDPALSTRDQGIGNQRTEPDIPPKQEPPVKTQPFSKAPTSPNKTVQSPTKAPTSPYKQNGVSDDRILRSESAQAVRPNVTAGVR